MSDVVNSTWANLCIALIYVFQIFIIHPKQFVVTGALVLQVFVACVTMPVYVKARSLRCLLDAAIWRERKYTRAV